MGCCARRWVLRLEVLAGRAVALVARRVPHARHAGNVPVTGGRVAAGARGKGSPHLGDLGLRGHLLGEQRCLDAVEEAFEPADELRLRDAELSVRRGLLAEGKRDALELVGELGGEAVLELLDGAPVDLGQAHPTRLVERGVADLLEQLLDHRPDAHDLGRLLDEVSRVGRVVVVRRVGRHPHPVLGHNDDALLLLGVLGLGLLRLLGHGSILPHASRGLSSQTVMSRPAAHCR